MISIPYGRQCISAEDIQAVVEVLQSDFLTQGPAVPAFEQAVARHCQAKHAIAVNSATSALHLACLALDIGPGDRVWTSAVSFVASANCARYCGAELDFVDIDPGTGLMDMAALESKLQAAGRHTPKLLIPVHLAGQSCDMVTLARLAEQYGFAVLEDASHAIGGYEQGQPIGDCRFSDITVFSFHPVKLITTGEGGMALTQSGALAERMRRLSSHGISREPADMTQPSHGPWYYQQLDLGFNYRMTDIQAALGRSQLNRLDDFIQRRRALAERYDQYLHGLPLAPLHRRTGSDSAWHLYIIQLQDSTRHRACFEGLRKAGIGVNLHYIPIPAQPYYQQLGQQIEHYPNAMNYYRRAISLPLHPALSEAEQDYVIAQLKELLS